MSLEFPAESEGVYGALIMPLRMALSSITKAASSR
jgi:hypothetical protein